MKMEEFDALSTAHDYAFSFDEYKDIVHTIVSPSASSRFFNGNPRKMRLSADDIIVCDRMMTNGLRIDCSVSSSTSTKFQSNRPILLGMIAFAPVYIRSNRKFEELKWSFSIHVRINELSNTYSYLSGGCFIGDESDCDDESRIFLKFNVNLPSEKQTAIMLPEPVPIEPKFVYEFSLKQCVLNIDQFHFDGVEMMRNVKIEKDISIEFRDVRKIRNEFCVNFIGRVNEFFRSIFINRHSIFSIF